MRGERLAVSVTFDATKGYVALVPDLAEPITALSLAVLRRRIEERLLPDSVEVQLVLDRAARARPPPRWRGPGDGLRGAGALTVDNSATDAFSVVVNSLKLVDSRFCSSFSAKSCSSFSAKSDLSCRKLPFKRKRRISVWATMGGKCAVGRRCTQIIRHPFLSVS
jgi:hypothetical protein